jgi:hypothetical protein
MDPNNSVAGMGNQIAGPLRIAGVTGARPSATWQVQASADIFDQEDTMLKKYAALGAAVAALAGALAAATPATTGVFNLSDREAPRIMLDPSADNTDVYAFTAPDAQGKVTAASNWVPLAEPAGGPYFGKLDPAATYYTSAADPNLNYIQSYDLYFG